MMNFSIINALQQLAAVFGQWMTMMRETMAHISANGGTPAREATYRLTKGQMSGRSIKKEANYSLSKQLTSNSVLEAGLEPAQPSLAKGF